MKSFESKSAQIRCGDAIEIDGAYQYRALTEGPRIQRYWHALKLQQIELFCMPAPGDIIIDIGCGSGVIAEYLSRHAHHVTGIDASRSAIEFATAMFRRPNLEYRQALVEDIHFEDASVDRIYCMEVVEHIYLHQAELLLQQCHRMLNPSGHICITTPNYHGLWPLVEFTMDSLRLVPRMAEDQHVTHYHRNKLRQLLTSNGFSVITLRTFSTFAPFLAFFPKLANWAEIFERRVNLPFGNILLAVATKK